MAAVVIAESDMQFGEYDEKQVFHIEKSHQYIENLLPNGIKSCEFILKKNQKLYFVEAKRSCPNQITANSSQEKKEKYEEYIHDIALKMRHSLTLYANILLERYSKEGISEQLKDIHLADMEIRLVIVVKNAQKEWLIPFQDVFRKLLQDELHIWKIPSVSIINEEMARKKHFII